MLQLQLTWSPPTDIIADAGPHSLLFNGLKGNGEGGGLLLLDVSRLELNLEATGAINRQVELKVPNRLIFGDVEFPPDRGGNGFALLVEHGHLSLDRRGRVGDLLVADDETVDEHGLAHRRHRGQLDELAH